MKVQEKVMGGRLLVGRCSRHVWLKLAGSVGTIPTRKDVISEGPSGGKGVLRGQRTRDAEASDSSSSNKLGSGQVYDGSGLTFDKASAMSNTTDKVMAEKYTRAIYKEAIQPDTQNDFGRLIPPTHTHPCTSNSSYFSYVLQWPAYWPQNPHTSL